MSATTDSSEVPTHHMSDEGATHRQSEEQSAHSAARASLHPSDEDETTNPYEPESTDDQHPGDEADGEDDNEIKVEEEAAAAPDDDSSSAASSEAGSEDGHPEDHPKLPSTDEEGEDASHRMTSRFEEFSTNLSAVPAPPHNAPVGPGQSRTVSSPPQVSIEKVSFPPSANTSNAFPDNISQFITHQQQQMNVPMPLSARAVGGPGGPGRVTPVSGTTSAAGRGSPATDAIILPVSGPDAGSSWGFRSTQRTAGPISARDGDYFGGGAVAAVTTKPSWGSNGPITPIRPDSDSDSGSDAPAGTNAALILFENTEHITTGSFKPGRRRSRTEYEDDEESDESTSTEERLQRGGDEDEYDEEYSDYYYYYYEESEESEEYEYYEELYEEEVEEDEEEDEDPRIDIIEGSGHGRTMNDILYGTPKAGRSKRDVSVEKRRREGDDSQRYGSYSSRASTPERYVPKKKEEEQPHHVKKGKDAYFHGEPYMDGTQGNVDLDGFGGEGTAGHEPFTSAAVAPGNAASDSEDDDAFSQPSPARQKKMVGTKKDAKKKEGKAKVAGEPAAAAADDQSETEVEAAEESSVTPVAAATTKKSKADKKPRKKKATAEAEQKDKDDDAAASRASGESNYAPLMVKEEEPLNRANVTSGEAEKPAADEATKSEERHAPSNGDEAHSDAGPEVALEAKADHTREKKKKGPKLANPFKDSTFLRKKKGSTSKSKEGDGTHDDATQSSSGNESAGAAKSKKTDKQPDGGKKKGFFGNLFSCCGSKDSVAEGKNKGQKSNIEAASEVEEPVRDSDNTQAAQREAPEKQRPSEQTEEPTQLLVAAHSKHPASARVEENIEGDESRKVGEQKCVTAPPLTSDDHPTDDEADRNEGVDIVVDMESSVAPDDAANTREAPILMLESKRSEEMEAEVAPIPKKTLKGGAGPAASEKDEHDDGDRKHRSERRARREGEGRKKKQHRRPLQPEEEEGGEAAEEGAEGSDEVNKQPIAHIRRERKTKAPERRKTSRDSWDDVD